MNIPHTILRTMLALGASLTALAAAHAEYPDKPIKIIVPFTPGGFSDNVARLVAKGLEEQLHANAIIENRPGAGGNLGAAVAARAPNDGYTLFLANVASNAINPNIYKGLEVDPAQAFDAVSLIVRTPNVMAVNNDVKANSVADVVALAKAKPGGLNFGTPGTGTSGHMTGMLFNSLAGVNIIHVPYKGTPQALSDLVGGRIQVTFDNITTIAPQANAGRIRALAVTSNVRSPLLPDTPTMQELGYAGFEATSWTGIVVPKGTPPAIIEKLNAAINKTIVSEPFKAALNGGQIEAMTPARFRAFIATDRQRWREVAKQVKIELD